MTDVTDVLSGSERVHRGSQDSLESALQLREEWNLPEERRELREVVKPSPTEPETPWERTEEKQTYDVVGHNGGVMFRVSLILVDSSHAT